MMRLDGSGKIAREIAMQRGVTNKDIGHARRLRSKAKADYTATSLPESATFLTNLRPRMSGYSLVFCGKASLGRPDEVIQ